MAGGPLSLIESITHSGEAAVHGMVVAGALTLIGLKAKDKLARDPSPELPDEHFSLKFIFENIASFVMKMGDKVMGEQNRKYLPFCATIFVYILFCNLIGLVPGFSAPSDSMTFNLGVALVVFVMYNVWGIKAVGAKAYLKHFIGPVWWLAPLFLILEPVSHLVRPISLSMRLFGNMTADHSLLQISIDLTRFVLPVVFYLMGAFVSCIQAFVFMILTMIYIRLAVAEEH